MEPSGFLNIYKPVGKTSFAMVSLVRKLTGLKRVGHGGTLDPLASGVLPICIGQATRLSGQLLTAGKCYRARFRLGVETDTYDAQGHIVGGEDPSSITAEIAEEALRGFRGQISQVPPMFSALKREGQRLYKLARAGIEVERKPRTVEVYRLEMTAWEPPSFEAEVECSRGTYIRSLAHDLGEALGCGGHLELLTRTRSGPFTIDDSLSVGALYDAAHGGYLGEHLYPMDVVVMGMSAAIVDEDGQQAIQHGKLLASDGANMVLRPPEPGELCRAYNNDGELIAMLSYDADRHGWQPAPVFIGSS